MTSKIDSSNAKIKWYIDLYVIRKQQCGKTDETAFGERTFNFSNTCQVDKLHWANVVDYGLHPLIQETPRRDTAFWETVGLHAI